MWQYYQVTGDEEFLIQHGAEMAFEVARFLFSHAYFKKDKNRYEFIRLLGPDEYHENVDNNAFTNYQAHFALDKAVTIYKLMKETHPNQLRQLCNRIGVDEQEVSGWQEMVALLYLPKPDEETLLIEQCDGFFDLEDVSVEEIRQRLIDPQEYWGWPNGIAVRAQVLKQADAVQLLALHDTFSKEIIRANYDYYEPRTEHGSSLSPSVHAIVASKAGYDEQAYAYFTQAATIDIYNQSKKVVSGGSFLGGIHTAACGAVWQIIVFGFAGLKVAGRQLAFQPRLPHAWEAVSFRIYLHADLFSVNFTAHSFNLHAAEDNNQPVTLCVNHQCKTLNPGQAANIPL
jgi:kojibiose phosphorylase